MKLFGEKKKQRMKKICWIIVIMISFSSIFAFQFASAQRYIPGAGPNQNTITNILQPSNGQILQNYVFTRVGNQAYINGDPVSPDGAVSNNIQRYRGSSGSTYAVSTTDNSVIGVNDGGQVAGGTTQAQTAEQPNYLIRVINAAIVNSLGQVFGYLGNSILRIFSLLLFICAALLNQTVQLTVIGMKSTIDNLSAINIVWKAFRDLANILFIFILLYISIGTILRLSSVNTKKILMNLVIVALLINFSLFFTKVIIDFSNTLSFQFYNAISVNGHSLSASEITGNILSGGTSVVTRVGSRIDNGLSDAFMSALDLTTVYNYKPTTGNPLSAVGGIYGAAWTVLIGTIMGSVFILLASLIFLVSGILFIVRFVTLIILMMTSPLAFAAMILPGTHSYSKMWWQKLTKECLFAPLYFMMIWASLKLLQGGVLTVTHSPGGIEGFADLFTVGIVSGISNSIPLILNFFIVGAFMVGSLLIARAVGAQGANLAFTAFKTGQGFIGRNTVGEFGRSLEDRLGRTKWANYALPFNIRKVTTQKLAAAKFGSGSSRDEAYKEQIERESHRDTAKKAEGIRKSSKILDVLDDREKNMHNEILALEAAGHRKRESVEWKDAKRKEKELDEEIKKIVIEEQGKNKLTASEFAHAFDKEEYQNKNVLRLATPNQIKAVEEKREDMSDEEKEHMQDTYYERLVNNHTDYSKEMERFRERADKAAPRWASMIKSRLMKNGMSEGAAKIRAEKEVEGRIQMEGRKIRDESRSFSQMHTFIRAMTLDQLMRLREIHPQLLTDPNFAPSIRFLKIQAMRDRGDVTPEQSDQYRYAKAGNLHKAAETGYAPLIVENVGDNAASELGGHKKRDRQDPRIVRYASPEVAAEIVGKDMSDIKSWAAGPVWDLQRAIKRFEEGKAGQITQENYDLWKWVAEDEEGKGKKFLASARAQGLKIPDIQTIKDYVDQGAIEVVPMIEEIDLREEGDWANWDRLMGESTPIDIWNK